MTQPTKADLTAAVAKLTEENAGLRDEVSALYDIFAAVKDASQADHSRHWVTGYTGSINAETSSNVRTLRAHAVAIRRGPTCGMPIGDPDDRVYCALPSHGPERDHEPEYPAVGSAIPPERNGGQSGYRVGECGHRVAGSEWRAGFRRCEHCEPDLGDDEREYCPECGADEDAGEGHADKCAIGDEAAASVTA